MSTNPGGGAAPQPKQVAKRPAPLVDRATAMKRVRALQDPETAAVNEYYRRTGQIPHIVGSTPMPGALPSGIAGTRFTAVNRPGGENLPPGIAINRAKNAGTLPGTNPQGRQPVLTNRRARTAGAPRASDLPRSVALVRPGPGPRRTLQQYGAVQPQPRQRRRRNPRPYGPFVPSSPSIPSSPPPALRPGVPPPSYFDLVARADMETHGPGWLKIPIIYKGTLPDVMYDEFDASTGYHPRPGGWKGTEEQERRYKAVREGSLRGVDFATWNTSWLMRMAQLKGVDMSEVGGGEAAKQGELERMLNDVKRAEAVVAKKAAEAGTDGLRWAKFEGRETEVQTHILLEDEKDELEVIKEKVATALRGVIHIDAKEVSLWVSAVTWGNLPSRMVRFAGRNAEIDDGYWLGLYVYRMSRGSIVAEQNKENIERCEREMRDVVVEGE